MLSIRCFSWHRLYFLHTRFSHECMCPHVGEIYSSTWIVVGPRETTFSLLLFRVSSVAASNTPSGDRRSKPQVPDPRPRLLSPQAMISGRLLSHVGLQPPPSTTRSPSSPIVFQDFLKDARGLGKHSVLGRPWF